MRRPTVTCAATGKLIRVCDAQMVAYPNGICIPYASGQVPAELLGLVL